MAIQVVRLGTERGHNEGLRIGTVRRPPRGVARSDYAAGNWYDVWLPDLAPSAELVKLAQAAETVRDWQDFSRKYRRELAEPAKRRLLDLLAALSRQTDFSIGCYCADAARCHRTVLKEVLAECGARFKETAAGT